MRRYMLYILLFQQMFQCADDAYCERMLRVAVLHRRGFRSAFGAAALYRKAPPVGILIF